MVTGGPVILELTVVATEGPLVALGLVVMVTGAAVVPFVVSREVNVSVVSVTGWALVTGESLAMADGSGSDTDVLAETS